MAKTMVAKEVTEVLVKISLETSIRRDHIPKIVNMDPFPFQVLLYLMWQIAMSDISENTWKYMLSNFIK
jgi:hypothetical protein